MIGSAPDPLPIRSLMDPVMSPLTDPEMSPLMDPEMSPIMDPVMSPLMDPQMSPWKDPVMSPFTDPVMSAIMDPEMSPLMDPEMSPLMDTKFIPRLVHCLLRIKWLTRKGYCLHLRCPNYGVRCPFWYVLIKLGNDNVDIPESNFFEPRGSPA